ncbi:DUF4087 domain-containing protein [Laspinema olomoucense]|uniref:DUF4087 domain-containing protein n=2 Tax=Laspinema TaxID=2584823 RepID=A0ABT2N8V1_9CYAN|nr:DUF4087 domain-containing protein [Laspinema sp. D3a]MCT7979007.1 DUF4087 domain-containing protein [Laspinema sp. D3b]MCT7991404.1 DUF4087 domain-containing protein [Laspinema sp. D3a]
MQKIGWVTLALISTTLPAQATELRCGWLHNPTPANWWLTDKDASWTIGAQGGYQAQGMENIPEGLSAEQFVRTNGYYGYGCACLEVVTDSERQRIVRIEGGEALELSVCSTDPDLPAVRR